MRNLLFAALILLASGCVSAPDPEALCRQARQELRAGHLGKAQQLVDSRGLRRWRASPESRWYWETRLLDAELLMARGENGEALRLLAEAAPDKPELGAVRVRQRLNEGLVRLRLGQFDRAETCLEEAAAGAIRIGQPALALDVAVVRTQLLAHTGEGERVEEALQQTLEQATRARDPYNEAAVLINWSLRRMRQYRYDEALAFAVRAIDSAKAARAERFECLALTNAGASYYRLGDYDRALESLERAIRIAERLGSIGDLQAALGEGAAAHLQLGDARSAAASYGRAYDIASRAGLRPYAAKWAGNLALTYAELRNWPEAARFNAISYELKKNGSDPQSLAHAKSNDAIIAAGSGRHDDAVRLYAETLQAAARNTALVWEAEAGLAALYASQGEPALARAHYERAIATIAEARSSLNATEHKITFLSRLIRFYQEYVEFLLRQGAAERALQIVEASRARLLAGGTGSGQTGRSRTYREYRQMARRADVVILSYWLARERSYVWVVGGGRDPVLIELPPEQRIAALTRDYVEYLAAPRELPRAGLKAGRELYAMLIEPARKAMGSHKNVIVIPDGALHGLNFEALVEPGGDEPRYWIEDASVTVAPSLDILAGQPGRGKSRVDTLLIIGDPEPVDPAYPKLLYTRGEIERLNRQFGAAARQVYTGQRANPDAYAEAGPERFSLIHFSAHAVANRASPLDSAVILSRHKGRYKLYAREIMQRPIDADLVTISACRSAGARAYSGEGLVGLAWAFLRAGARRVIAGLWDVGDRSTAELMGEMYAQLDGKTPDARQALRRAKLRFIASGGPYAKPYYWAPFQLYTRTP